MLELLLLRAKMSARDLLLTLLQTRDLLQSARPLLLVVRFRAQSRVKFTLELSLNDQVLFVNTNVIGMNASLY